MGEKCALVYRHFFKTITIVMAGANPGRSNGASAKKPREGICFGGTFARKEARSRIKMDVECVMTILPQKKWQHKESGR